MKLIIENLENGDVKLTLNFRKNNYTEVWRGYKTIDGCIEQKLIEDGIYIENTELDEFINSIDVGLFSYVAESEYDDYYEI